MKILHTVESYLPRRHGMQEVVTQLSERLARMGHEVIVATSYDPDRRDDVINGVRIADFNVSGNLVKGIEGELDNYQTFLRNSEFDIVTNFAAQQWATDGMITILNEVSGKKVFVPTGFSALNSREYDGYFSKMKGWMNQYDMNVFPSNDYQDIQFAREGGVSKIAVIPNGASEDEFLTPSNIDIRSILGIGGNCFLILHVGSYSGIKGHREAVEIFRRARIRNACLLLVGSNKAFLRSFAPSEYARYFLHPIDRGYLHKRVVAKRFKREQTVAAFQQADLFLFPSNIECSPIVFFECMASRTPFLTSDVGNAKEIIEWSNGAGILLPTRKDERGYSHAGVKESARILEDCFHHPKKLKEMAENGFNQWGRRFTWERIAEEYEKLYRTLLQEPHTLENEESSGVSTCIH